MVVVFSKEKPLHCGNCKARLETACFRCLQCGEIVSCPKCDLRESHEDRAYPSRPFDHPPCSRGGFASRGRGFDAPHFACPRGGFSPRGSFDYRHRPNFCTVPFPGSNRGGGFGPRGFTGFPPRGSFPASFRPIFRQGGIEDCSEMHGRGCGSFPARGGAGFPRGVSGRGMARGRCGFFRGRGGFSPFSGSRMGMGCVDCDCNHLRVFPDMEEENNDGGNGGACNCVAPGMGEENHPDVREGSPTMVEESIHDVSGDDATDPVCVDYEG